MIRVVEMECSQFTPGGRWVWGSEYYAIDGKLEYPDELDELSDDELAELADSDDERVKWID